MTGPNRCRKAESIKQVVNDVRRIFISIGVKNDMSIILVDDLKLLEEWVEHHSSKGTLPGTIRKYLFSLRDFLKYLASRTTHHKMEETRFKHAEYILTEWKKKFKRKDNLQAQKRKYDDQK